jgi:hypothetical protein
MKIDEVRTDRLRISLSQSIADSAHGYGTTPAVRSEAK